MDLQDVVAGKLPAAAGEAFYGLHHYQATAVVGGSGHDDNMINQIMAAPVMLQEEGVGVYEEVDFAAGGGGSAGGGGRWPRQETLTLLEVRRQLDCQFREAAQKGPLWEEVSRIMAEEHGYQRSGKKCREKLENLYKYYKKTKEGKAGRQDGKHYRFFRQLEALYGRDQTTFPNFTEITNPLHSNSLNLHSPSLPNSGESSASKEDEEQRCGGRSTTSRRGKNSQSCEMKELLDVQIRRLMEVQESWMNKMLETLESKEEERISKEEAWRQREAARSDRERSLCAAERAWIEARDCAIIESLQKIISRKSSLNNTSVDRDKIKLSEHDSCANLVKLENGYCNDIMDDRPLMDGSKLIRRCNYNNERTDRGSSQQEFDRQMSEEVMIPSSSSYVISPSTADHGLIDNGHSFNFLVMRGGGEGLQWKQRGLDI